MRTTSDKLRPDALDASHHPAMTDRARSDALRARKSLGRRAGILYLLLALTGMFAEVVVRGKVYVPDDATATASRIAEHVTLMRAGIVSDIVQATLFVFLGLTLSKLLREVSRSAAAAIVVFTSVGAGLILLNLVFQWGALLVATKSSYATAFGVDGRHSLALLLMDLHHYGYTIGGVFFGLWLLPVGYVGYRFGLLPRVLSVLLIIACFVWILSTLVAFAFPDADSLVTAVISVPTIIAEFWLIGYLLSVGVRAPDPTSADPTGPMWPDDMVSSGSAQ